MDKLDLIVDRLESLEARVEGKLDKLQSDTDTIKLTQIEMCYDVRRNADDLELHMQRTKLNEQRISTVEDKHDNRMASIEEKLTLGHLLKLVVITAGGISTIVGAAYGVIKLIDYLTK